MIDALTTHSTAGLAESLQSVLLLRYEPELVLPHMVHDRSAKDVLWLRKLFVIAEETVHILSASPHTILEQLGPFLLAMHHSHVSGLLAK